MVRIDADKRWDPKKVLNHLQKIVGENKAAPPIPKKQDVIFSDPKQKHVIFRDDKKEKTIESCLTHSANELKAMLEKAKLPKYGTKLQMCTPLDTSESARDPWNERGWLYAPSPKRDCRKVEEAQTFYLRTEQERFV